MELAPLPTDETIELTIRSTTRPTISNTAVKNRVAKPRIGAKELVKTPAFSSVRLVLADSPTTNTPDPE